MSIRSEAIPYRGNLSSRLQEVLRKNGMQAQLAVENNRYLLVVQGHDSPMISYNISEQQFRAMADGGTNSADKKAYKTFNNIVGKDFDMPSSYIAAKSVNGRVITGLHGYRDSPDMLGWTPRQQEGLHLRRIAGVAMSPMVAEHADGRLRPGELKSGDYGYYYKGHAQQQATDPLKDMQTYLPSVQTRPRQQEPAKPYNEVITSQVYFTNEKLQEVLSSHGIIIDADKKLLTIQSTATQQDFTYDLTANEVAKLTDNSLKSTSMDKRLGILNNVISGDFHDKITMDMLNSKEHLSITLKPEVEQSLKPRVEAADTVQVTQDPVTDQHHVAPTLDPEQGYTNGQDLSQMNDRKGWYREGKNGREVNVGDIWVTKDDKGTCKMSAVINGEVITHEISQKQYDKFMAVDDYQRQRMMSKIFNEVDMKTRPEMRQGFNFGAFLGAGLTAVGEATAIGAGIAHNIEHIKHPHGASGVNKEMHGTGRIYVKPSVDSPQDIAERAFDAGLNAGMHAGDVGHRR